MTKVRLWHFIALPTLGMGVMIFLGRLIGSAVDDRFGPAGLETYVTFRPIVTTLVMVSLIAWLALTYRRQYETELGRRNTELEETRDFLANVIGGSGEAIVTLDAKGRVSSWNPAAERIFGWTAGEMIGNTFRCLLPDDPAIVEERNRVGHLVRQGRTVRDFQTTRLHKSGARINVRITWAPIYSRSGEFDGVVGIVLDITSETEIKRRLLEHERLAAVGEMAAQMAHEVRNPLAGIRGACEMVFGRNTDPETRSEVGHEVVRQIDRLNRTVEELLQFANPRALEPTATDLNELIDRVAGVHWDDPRTRGVTLVRDYALDLPAIPLDAAKIEQVFYNLFLNASQMMNFEGTVAVATRIIDDRVLATVRDTGPGIDPEMREKIFKPFVTTRTSGTGLGLAIVRKIVEAHGGTIEASTDDPPGAEFRIRLPATRPNEDGPKPDASRTAD